MSNIAVTSAGKPLFLTPDGFQRVRVPNAPGVPRVSPQSVRVLTGTAPPAWSNPGSNPLIRYTPTLSRALGTPASSAPSLARAITPVLSNPFSLPLSVPYLLNPNLASERAQVPRDFLDSLAARPFRPVLPDPGNLDDYFPTDSAPIGVGVPVTWNVCSDLITNAGQFAGTGCVQVQGNSNDTFTQLREGSNGDYVLRHFDGSGQQVAVINRFNPGLSTISGLRWQIVPGTIGTPSGDPAPGGNPLPLDNHLPDIAPVGFPSPIGLPGVVPGLSPGGNPSPLGATSPRGNLDPLPSPISSPASDPPPFARAGDIPGLLPPLLLPSTSTGASPRSRLAGNPAVRTPGSPSSGQQPINTTNPQYQPEPQRVPVTGPSPTCNNDPCMSTVMGRQAQQSQQLSNIERAINAGGQVVDLGLLAIINNKLGPQLPGGLSGFAGKTWNTLKTLYNKLGVDRALNILTYVTTLHNAMMLSNALSQTLFSAIGNTLAVFGMGEVDDEGNVEPLNISQIASTWTDNFFKSIFGVATVDGLKAVWKKANRIYQAASNLLWSVQSIGYSILSVLEVIGSWNAQIGNALRKWGAVGERAYGWMNPQPEFQNRWFTALQNVGEVVEQVDQISSEVLSAQQTVNQIDNQFEDLQKTIAEDPGSKQKPAPPPQAAAKATAEAAAKALSDTVPISSTDEVPPPPSEVP